MFRGRLFIRDVREEKEPEMAENEDDRICVDADNNEVPFGSVQAVRHLSRDDTKAWRKEHKKTEDKEAAKAEDKEGESVEADPVEPEAPEPEPEDKPKKGQKKE